MVSTARRAPRELRAPPPQCWPSSPLSSTHSAAQVGAGVLGLPHAVGHLGWVGGMLFLVFSFWVSWHTYKLLVLMHEVPDLGAPKGLRRLDRYDELAEYVLGAWPGAGRAHSWEAHACATASARSAQPPATTACPGMGGHGPPAQASDEASWCCCPSSWRCWWASPSPTRLWVAATCVTLSCVLRRPSRCHRTRTTWRLAWRSWD